MILVRATVPFNPLKNLPIDVLKLDILFFQKSWDIRRERIVVSNVINMAKELDIKTIAEGVEDMDTVEFFKKSRLYCNPGICFAKPMPQEDFEHLLTDNQDGSLKVVKPYGLSSIIEKRTARSDTIASGTVRFSVIPFFSYTITIIGLILFNFSGILRKGDIQQDSHQGSDDNRGFSEDCGNPCRECGQGGGCL